MACQSHEQQYYFPQGYTNMGSSPIPSTLYKAERRDNHGFYGAVT